MSDPSAKRIILGVAASDAHVVANHLIAHLLRAHGYDVVNLGACTPLEAFAKAYAEYPDAIAILIGSLNGHAFDDLRDLPALRAAGKIPCPIVIGGNLSVGAEKCDAKFERLRALGIDHILASIQDILPTLARIAENKAEKKAEKKTAQEAI